MERCVDDVVVSTNDEKVQSHIPNDLFFCILSKLSIKSLKRFGCVCKSWSVLFDNPNFMNVYRKSFLTKIHPYYDNASLLVHKTIQAPFDGFYCDKKFELYAVSNEGFENMVKLDWPNVILDNRPYPLPSLPGYDSDFHILGSGSVQGTLCLLCAYLMNIVLWNPSTKEFKLIPPSPVYSEPDWQQFSTHQQAFGYDRISGDYKVMRHIQFPRKRDYDADVMLEIYSLRSNSWRKLDTDMHHSANQECGQLYMDGLSHWLCDRRYLVSFDWSNEVFLTTTPVPSEMTYGYECNTLRSHLVLLNGSIALILVYDGLKFHISILGEIGVKESWTKLFIVGPLPCFEYPIGVGKKGDILFMKNGGELAWFNLNTQTIEDLGVMMERLCCKIVIHKENIVPFEVESI